MLDFFFRIAEKMQDKFFFLFSLIIKKLPVSLYRNDAIDPSTIRACYPSTIQSGPFSLLCFQPQAVQVLFNALDSLNCSSGSIATQDLEWASSQHSAKQILIHHSILIHRFKPHTRVTDWRCPVLALFMLMISFYSI